jgi:hypothetical protein
LFSLAKITRQNLLCPDHIVVTAAGEWKIKIWLSE